MTNGDKIRAMSDNELAELLTWGMICGESIQIPNCDDGCEDFGVGCAFSCSHDKRQRSAKKWLQEEWLK